jgi:hypothetical protein
MLVVAYTSGVGLQKIQFTKFVISSNIKINNCHAALFHMISRPAAEWRDKTVLSLAQHPTGVETVEVK